MRCSLWLIPAFLLLFSLPAQAAVRNLSPAEAKTLLQKNPQVFLLDVRTVEEYRRARLAGGRLISIDEVERRLGEIPAERPVLIYCAVGARSSQVAKFLERRGYREIYNLLGGIWAWQLGGYPVLSGGP